MKSQNLSFLNKMAEKWSRVYSSCKIVAAIIKCSESEDLLEQNIQTKPQKKSFGLNVFIHEKKFKKMQRPLAAL